MTSTLRRTRSRAPLPSPVGTCSTTIFWPSIHPSRRRPSFRASTRSGSVPPTPPILRIVGVDCASAPSGAARRPPVKVPRNARRFVAGLRLAASSKGDGAGRPAGRPYTRAAALWARTSCLPSMPCPLRGQSFARRFGISHPLARHRMRRVGHILEAHQNMRECEARVLPANLHQESRCRAVSLRLALLRGKSQAVPTLPKHGPVQVPTQEVANLVRQGSQHFVLRNGTQKTGIRTHDEDARQHLLGQDDVHGLGVLSVDNDPKLTSRVEERGQAVNCALKDRLFSRGGGPLLCSIHGHCGAPSQGNDD